ncbi:hypothetical protein [Rhizobium rhizogenes]|uniref:hypothetical protein n=1 Tax=Rhizobium rhizogenes TaxID=359 RepID=UPI0022BF42B7|nr:hypothetical protein [Rhizobium rhizogenes]MCZ7484574.1 hypothetical protein [Rhizobium rhizogenes]
MFERNTELSASQIQNGRDLVERLRNNPDNMIDFAAWVVEKMWISLVDQGDVVVLDMAEALDKSGFNRDFLGCHPGRIA